MMGAGKTSVGALAATELGLPHVDTDELVLARLGCTMEVAFEHLGVDVFREAEAEVVERLAARRDAAVVSVAGGAVLNARSQRTIRAGGLVVWLRARPETLIARLGPTGGGRPLLASGGERTLRRIDADRRAVYASVADRCVDVDARSPEDVMRDVVSLYRGRQPGHGNRL